MKHYEILEHTADLKIRAFGKTKEELFVSMLQGMFESQKSEVRSRKSEVKRKIKVTSGDLSSLLVDFLSEALYLSSVNREAYFDAKFTKFSDQELEGELSGRKVERFGEDIKAVTYHGLEIREKGGRWEATVLFDI